jgi:serine O-acetyltransferase
MRSERTPHPPRFIVAVIADAKTTAAYRSERWEFRGTLDALVQAARLAWRSDAFLGQVFYRAQARLRALGVPILPRLAHRLAMITAQLSIGDDVVVEPGVYFAHGQVVIDGDVIIERGVVVNPWVVIGGADEHAAVEGYTQVGTGATITGPVTIGKGSRIGANAVVLEDVPGGTTVVGVPARPARSTT